MADKITKEERESMLSWANSGDGVTASYRADVPRLLRALEDTEAALESEKKRVSKIAAEAAGYATEIEDLKARIAARGGCIEPEWCGDCPACLRRRAADAEKSENEARRALDEEKRNADAALESLNRQAREQAELIADLRRQMEEAEAAMSGRAVALSSLAERIRFELREMDGWIARAGKAERALEEARKPRCCDCRTPVAFGNKRCKACGDGFVPPTAYANVRADLARVTAERDKVAADLALVNGLIGTISRENDELSAALHGHLEGAQRVPESGEHDAAMEEWWHRGSKWRWCDAAKNQLRRPVPLGPRKATPPGKPVALPEFTTEKPEELPRGEQRSGHVVIEK